MIAQSSIDRIRDLDIKSVIEKFLPAGSELKKNGSGWKAKSPFNAEHTPSFYVVPAKQLFKDFSSGHGGDAIRFVMLYEKCSFIEAIEKIAAATGERLEYDRPATDEEKHQHDRNTELLKINEAAAKRFAEQLLNTDGQHPAFKEVIDKRRFTPDTLLQWQIGYAPDEWKFLTKTLTEKGLIDQGKTLDLVREKNENVYDTFRHRVIYPIFNERGQIVSFGGRALPTNNQQPSTNNDVAKYMNGAESPLYHKSKTLYGLNFASHAIRKHGYAQLVEGYTDVISFNQAGYPNTVGTCGTSLTDDQCKLLKRYCTKVILFPDHDEPTKAGELGAGERSALRSIDLLMQHGFEVHIVPMPELPGHKVDPDELVRMCEPVMETV